MKGIVVYYSATGNNTKVARAIHRGMKQVIDADIATVKEANPKEMGKYDLIGIGSPIWFQRETANTRQFMYDLPDMKGKLAFIFSVHGVTSGHIFNSMVPPLQRKGLSIIGWNDWFGTYYTSLHRVKPAPIDGHPDAIDLKEAEAFGKEMAEKALKIKAGDKSLIPAIPHGPTADLMFQPYGRMLFFPTGVLPRRKINMAKCKYPACTQCIDNCVAKALDFTKTPPVFNAKNTCINCCLCDRMCPTGAIEYPEEDLRTIRTIKKINMAKCKYPKCTICVDHCMMNAIDFSKNPPEFKYSCEGDDLCWVICPEGAIEITNFEVTHRAQRGRQVQAGRDVRENAVDKREREGRFRRYVPPEKVGTEGAIMDMKQRPIYDIKKIMKEAEES